TRRACANTEILEEAASRVGKTGWQAAEEGETEMNEGDSVMQPVIDDLNRMPEERRERLSGALRGRRVLIGQSGGDALAGSLGNAPRGSRPSKRRQRGVFEKVPGSDIWWIRYSD